MQKFELKALWTVITILLIIFTKFFSKLKYPFKLKRKLIE